MIQLTPSETNLYCELDDFSREDLWEVMARKGWHLPPKKCQWVTKKLMQAVALGHTWCPRFETMR